MNNNKFSLSHCLNFKRDLERILDYIKSFDFITGSSYTKTIEELKENLDKFIDNNFNE